MTIRYISRFGEYGTAAGQFNSWPSYINVDLSGYIWVVDHDDPTGDIRVQKFTSAGVYSSGFTCPEMGGYAAGMAVSPTLNYVYLIQYGPDEYVYIYTKAGVYVGTFSTSETSISSITVDASGYVYTSHSSNKVKKWTSVGVAVTSWGSTGTGHGEFDNPWLIRVNLSSGNIYVLDDGAAGWLRIQQFTNTGTWVSQFEGDDDYPEDGWQTIVNLNDFCVDKDGNIYMDSGRNNRRVHKYDSSYTFVEFFGTEGEDTGQFEEINGVAYNHTNNQICVSDEYNDNISLWSPTSATGDKVVIHSNTRGNPFLSLLNSVVVGDKVSILTGNGGTFCRKV